MKPDFIIGNAKHFGMDNYRGRNLETIDEENLTESFIEYCQGLKGYEDGGRLYGAGSFVGVKQKGITIPSGIEQDSSGMPGEYYGKEFIPFNTNEQGEFEVYLYGAEDFAVNEMQVWEGESDLNVIKEKLRTGDYIVYAAPVTDKGAVRKDRVLNHPGDKVTLTYKDQNGEPKEKEVTVLSVIKEDYWNLTTRMSDYFPYYMGAEPFKEIASDKFLMSYSFDVKDGYDRETDAALKGYTSSSEPLMDYSSKLQYEKSFYTLTNMFLLIGGALAFVIGVIGILNFINSILTGIITRQREFAMMEAIGMTKRQLTKMVIAEGLYYAILTVVFSLVAGSLFSLTAVRILSEGMWFMRYEFMIAPMLVVFPILLVLGGLVPYLAFRFGRRGTVVEELQKE